MSVILSELVTRAKERGKPVVCIGNTFFDTTFANTSRQGALAVNAPCEESLRTAEDHPFKGNADIDKMAQTIKDYGPENIGLMVMTVVNNTIGGQPVSLQNLRAAHELAKQYDILFILDAARIFENAYFIQQREKGYRNKSIQEIVHAMTELADVVLMSAKKDAIVNMGGLIATNNKEIYKLLEPLCILTIGHYSYGGLSGRDLAAMTVGLKEGMEQDYLRARINQVTELGNGFRRLGLPIQWPPGSNGIYLDGRSFLPDIDPLFFPAQRICAEIYKRYGIRAVEVGLSLAGRDANGIKVIPDKDFVRFTIPRRMLTGEHIDFILEALQELHDQQSNIGGLMLKKEGKGNAHFVNRFDPVTRAAIRRLKAEVLKDFNTPKQNYASNYLPPNARRYYGL